MTRQAKRLSDGAIFTVVREGEDYLFLSEIEGGLCPVKKDNFALLPSNREAEKYALKKSKPRISLIPPRALLEVAKAFTDGERKYGMHDYQRAEVSAQEYLDAAGRHWNALLQGEDLAQDSKLNHAAHAAACFLIYLELHIRGVLKDDRFKEGA